MKHIVLIGDSIFDNASYVGLGESVIDLLTHTLPQDAHQSTLLAVDGDITTEVYEQLKHLPNDTTHAFLSIGGNDALRVVDVLEQSTSTVGSAMETFTEIRLDFQKRYRDLINVINQRVEKFIICTVHDCVPGIEPRSLTALALFNEIILKEAFSLGISVLDLRLLSNEEADYSTISPIEPSAQGGKKITACMAEILKSHDFNQKGSCIFK